MASNQCIPQTISKYFMGLIFLGLSVVFVIFGFTLLPVFGFIMAVPVAGISLYFFRVHLNKECSIDLSA